MADGRPLRLEIAVADGLLAFDRDEVRIGPVAVEAPRPPLGERSDSCLGAPGLIGITLARDVVQRFSEIGAFGERLSGTDGGSIDEADATSSSEMT